MPGETPTPATAGPLTGRRIVLTRVEAGALADALAALGADVVHVPFIEIGPPIDGGRALRQALARLDAFDWVVVTSVNGARAVGAAVAAHPRVRLGAVGAATAAVLADLAGRRVDLVPTVPRAEGLVAEFPAGSARVLVAHADRAREVLVEGLTAAGHRVEGVTAYATVERRPSPDELRRLAGVDAVVFASGSAAIAWSQTAGTPRPRVVVAIGPVTEAAARRAGLAVTHVAHSPGPQGVSAALVDAFGRAWSSP